MEPDGYEVVFAITDGKDGKRIVVPFYIRKEAEAFVEEVCDLLVFNDSPLELKNASIDFVEKHSWGSKDMYIAKYGGFYKKARERIDFHRATEIE